MSYSFHSFLYRLRIHFCRSNPALLNELKKEAEVKENQISDSKNENKNYLYNILQLQR